MLELRSYPLAEDRRHVISRDVAINAAALLAGTVLQLAAYDSVELIAIAVVFYTGACALLYLTPVGGRAERRMFDRMFAVGWLMAGVAAIYAAYFDDSFQNTSDAAYFFELATQQSLGMTLTDLSTVTEGGGAVMLWHAIYNFFAALGFEKERYIGVTVNVTAVALSGVVAVKIARRVFGEDAVRQDRLRLLFSACGLMWLFAALHLRDSAALLCVTILMYCWIRYLTKSNTGNLALVGVATLGGFVGLGLLRAEFVFVPAAMLLAALAAIILFDRSRGSRKLFAYAIALVGCAVAVVILIAVREQLLLALGMGYQGYADETGAETQVDDSLGVRFIVGAPLPLRLLFGSVYLFVFPIPVWSGFQLESAYHLFKSFNALYFYALTPLLALTLVRLVGNRALRTPALTFLAFTVLGFMVAIAGTSLETRHFASFFAALAVLACVPDLRAYKDRTAYRYLTVAFVGAMVMLHAAWVALKFS